MRVLKAIFRFDQQHAGPEGVEGGGAAAVVHRIVHERLGVEEVVPRERKGQFVVDNRVACFQVGEEIAGAGLGAVPEIVTLGFGNQQESFVNVEGKVNENLVTGVRGQPGGAGVVDA